MHMHETLFVIHTYFYCTDENMTIIMILLHETKGKHALAQSHFFILSMCLLNIIIVQFREVINGWMEISA